MSERLLIWDMVLPLAPVVGNNFDLIGRFARAGHSYVSLTIAGDDCGLAEAMHRMATARAEIAKRSDALILARSVDDVRTAHADGKLAVGLHLEGTECLERDPAMLDVLYELGIRHAILAFNQNNSAAGGCADIGNVGLSRLGRRYLDHMRSLGMLLDLSHMSERATLEAMDHIGRPVTFTHSNASGVFPHYRNVTDRQARACAAAGGVIGLSGSSVYIGPSDNLVDGLFRHLDYLVQLIGPDHVGFGTDYVHDTKVLQRIFADRPDEWPADDVDGFKDLTYLAPEAIYDVIDRMVRAGYDDQAVAKIAAGNFMRVAEAVWT